jgi:sugar phosphate isomerase/epimerase
MIRPSVTISLVPEARGGPFVFWDDLEAAAATAKQLHFDAIEIFAPSPDQLISAEVTNALVRNGLALAAVGTGAGWVKHKLHLTMPAAADRAKAVDFIKSMIEAGAQHNAPAIIGSMQGRFGDGIDKETALGYLADALAELGSFAGRHGVPLIFEPLNRYETNLVNTVDDGLNLLKRINNHHVKLLADLFHMNIEEANIADSLKLGAGSIGHVHFVDSNRRPAGNGHIDLASVAAALNEIEFTGYASAEALPWPSPEAAARTTIESFHRYFRN